MPEILVDQIIELMLSIVILSNFFFMKLIKINPNKNITFRVMDKFFNFFTLIISLFFYAMWVLFAFSLYNNKEIFDGRYWIISGTIFLAIYLSNKDFSKKLLLNE